MPTVLVIDDDQAVRDTIGLVLAAAGYDVLFAADGRDGVEVFSALGSDLVVTDILMPRKDGIETIRDLRKMSVDLPIVALSGGGRTDSSDYLSIARNVGANRTLTKPFEPDDLVGIVSGLLSRPA